MVGPWLLLVMSIVLVCLLFVDCCSLCVARFDFLCDVGCSLFVAYSCLLFVVCRVLLVVSCLLIVCRLSCVACCLLRVAC